MAEEILCRKWRSEMDFLFPLLTRLRLDLKRFQQSTERHDKLDGILSVMDVAGQTRCTPVPRSVHLWKETQGMLFHQSSSPSSSDADTVDQKKKGFWDQLWRSSRSVYSPHWRTDPLLVFWGLLSILTIGLLTGIAGTYRILNAALDRSYYFLQWCWRSLVCQTLWTKLFVS